MKETLLPGPLRETSELDAEFTRKFLESTKLELEMRLADRSDPLWEKRIRNEWPIARVKRIMKSNRNGSPRMISISADAVHLMAYATRVFLRLIAARAAQFMIAEKRTTLLVRDIIAAVRLVQFRLLARHRRRLGAVTHVHDADIQAGTYG